MSGLCEAEGGSSTEHFVLQVLSNIELWLKGWNLILGRNCLSSELVLSCRDWWQRSFVVVRTRLVCGIVVLPFRGVSRKGRYTSIGNPSLLVFLEPVLALEVLAGGA